MKKLYAGYADTKRSQKQKFGHKPTNKQEKMKKHKNHTHTQTYKYIITDKKNRSKSNIVMNRVRDKRIRENTHIHTL